MKSGMKRIILLFCFMLQVNLFLSQNLMWAKRFAGTNTGVYAEAVTTDQSGNVLTTGSFIGNADFDPGPGLAFMSSASSNYYDIFISKLNLAGNYQWARSCIRTFGPGNCGGNAICTDASGNVYVTGYFSGTVNFDPAYITSYPLTAVGSTDIFVLKLDPNGEFVWAVQMGGFSAETGLSIAVDPLGNVYTTGHFSGVSDFDPSTGIYNLTSTGGTDIFVSKLNASGNFVWAKNIGGLGMERGNSLALDASLNVTIAGFFNHIVDFDPGTSTSTLSAVALSDDAFFMKLNNSGNFLWVKQISGSGIDRINAMVLDSPGNIYVTGGFNGTTDFDPSASTHTINTFGSKDIFVSKYDASGNFIWASQLGGSGGEEAYGMALNSLGEIYTTGAYASMCDFDPGIATYTIPMTMGQDIFVSRLNPSGGFVSAQGIGGTGPEMGRGITTDIFDDIIFTGQFPYGTGVDFDPGPGTYSYAPIGDDGYVVKYSDCATPATITASSSGSIVCSGESITVTAGGALTYTLYPGLTTGASQIFTPTLSGIYALIGSNSANCKDVVSFSINVNPNPTLSTTSSSSVFCAGQTATLTANGAITYTWNNTSNSSSIIITPTATTIYSYAIAGTNSLGCSVTNVFTISALPLPTITLVNNSSICLGQTFTLNPSGATTYTFSGGTSVVSPSVSTTYSVAGTTSGCKSANSATVLLTVNPLPTLTITGNSDICTGSSITQFVNGSANTYTWSDGSLGNVVSLTPTSTTIYSVVGTDANNCKNLTSKTITVNPLPNLSLTSSSSQICSGETSTLNITGANSYTWSNGSNSSFVIHSHTLTTTYSVSGIDHNGCSNLAAITQSVNTCTRLTNALNTSSKLKIFPNPSNGKLIIEKGILNPFEKIEIYNSLNQRVYFSISDSNSLELNISDYPNGVYLVCVYQNGRVIIQEKFIKM